MPTHPVATTLLPVSQIHPNPDLRTTVPPITDLNAGTGRLRRPIRACPYTLTPAKTN